MSPAIRSWREQVATRGWAGFVLLTIVLLDQVVKALVVARFSLGERVTVISGFFDLTYVLNPGGVWGLGRELAMLPRAIVFLALPVLITSLAIGYAWSLPAADRLRHAAIALVIGGAVGNLIDRIRLDPPAVIDFLLFHFRGSYWPAFNVADSAICVGVGVLLVSSFFEESPESASGPSQAGTIPSA
jgi:signal peptidase II